MARYISKEILCEAYTRLNTDLYNTDEARAKLKKQLLPFFEERARFLLGDDVRVEIIFETGSLVTKLRVIGSAGVVVVGLMANYGSFRDSVSHLTRDVKSLTESANLEVLFQTRTPYCDRVSIEKRKGVFGRVDELLSQLDKIKGDISSSHLPSTSKAAQEMESKINALISWNIRLEEFFSKLDSPMTQACVAEGILGEMKKMPKNFGWNNHLASSNIRGANVRTDPDLLGKLSGSNTRLGVTLNSIKSDLKKRLDQAKNKIKASS